MPGQAEQDGPLLTRLSSRGRLLSHSPQCVGRLGSWQKALAAREPHGFGKALVLFVGARLDDLVVDQHAERWCIAVVAESTRMNPIGDEAVSERENLHHRSHTNRVAEVIRIDPARKRRTRSR